MKSVRLFIQKVVSGQYYAVLSSTENGRAYSNLIAFVTVDGLKNIVFATGRNTAKFDRIKHHGQVSLLIDNRTNRPSDISRAVAITAIGDAGELQTNGEDLKELFIRRHPRLREFINSPETAMILVKTSEYVVARFHRTEVIFSKDL